MCPAEVILLHALGPLVPDGPATRQCPLKESERLAVLAQPEFAEPIKTRMSAFPAWILYRAPGSSIGSCELIPGRPAPSPWFVQGHTPIFV